MTTLTAEHKSRKGAANYVNVTLEDVETFLRRSFRAFKPQKQGVFGSEIYIELPIDGWARIQVMTSVSTNKSLGRAVGQDAIRITLLGPRSPLHGKGQFARVHRTQNWRDNLRERIEEALEYYEDRQSEWKARKNT